MDTKDLEKRLNDLNKKINDIKEHDSLDKDSNCSNKKRLMKIENSYKELHIKIEEDTKSFKDKNHGCINELERDLIAILDSIDT